MDKQTHTLGPWAIWCPSHEGWRVVQRDDKSKCIAVVTDGRSLPCGADYGDMEARANARLLAAAPDLLAALESATCPPWVHNAANTQDIEALRAVAVWFGDWNNKVRLPAIGKAKGE